MDQILSVCTGIGGLDLGLHAGLRRVGIEARTVCMVEREAFPCAVLGKAIQEGWMDEAPIWLGDLRELPLNELPEIDWYTGGYPCQCFSQAGKRMGEDDPRHLWPIILRQLKSLRPRGVFFENVSGHLSLGIDRVLQDLAGCGFSCAFGLFTAAEVGAPHRRERVFILGMDDTSQQRSGAVGKVRPRRDSIVSSGQAVADSDGRGLEGIGEEDDDNRSDERRNHTDGCCSDVADAEDIDGRGGRRAQERSEPSESGAVADCNGEGLEGRRRICEGSHQWPAGQGRTQRPDEPPRCVESRLGGAADGLADRVDRLRALGNGVVPQQAAHAFTTLYTELTR